MSVFTDYASKPVSQKITLFELDIGRLQDFWVNYRAGLWYLEFNKAYTSIIVVDQALITDISEITFERVGSVQSDGVNLTEVTSLATLDSTEQSFYFDNTNDHLYLHLTNHDEPSMHRLIMGDVYGYTTQPGIWNEVFYEGRLRSVPNITTTRDPIFFGIMRFQGGMVTLENTDGALDDFAEKNDVFGQEGRILVGFDDMGYSDFEKVFTGYVEDINITQESMQLSLVDKRKRMSRQIPYNLFTSTDYTNLNSTNEGKPIPLIWGVVKNVPAICLNEDEAAPSEYTFKLCDTEQHSISTLSTVYVTTSETVKQSVSFSGTDKQAATFILSSGAYTAGNIVTVDMTGYDDSVRRDGTGSPIETGLEVIKDILNNYLSYPYNANIFDTTEWTTAEADVRDIGMVIDNPTAIYTIIEQISNSLYGQFIVKDNGLFTFRRYNPSATYSQAIGKEEILNRTGITYSPKELVTSINVGHSKDWANNTYQYIQDTDDESSIYSKYRVYRSKTFDSLLTDSTDAQLLADDIMEQSGIIRKTFPIVTKLQSALRETFDWIYTDLTRANEGMLLDIKSFVEVIVARKDFNNNTVTLTCRIPKAQRVECGDGRKTDTDIIYGGSAGSTYTVVLSGGDAT
jgi:hypothetical protein